ncbi:MAG: lipoprotein-releasing ABC transporter ATP-binding protein LolD [Gammaproteobacteria bacterium]|nr:lipoprotein-releasing ABC transporter ATP-binding protein LolD [Gammaproteobacteria bacterium]NNC68603.1 lipoprotein-releasing ABC transporter ATP-binding protein LolD [Gammaproteobacteria bacterium]
MSIVLQCENLSKAFDSGPVRVEVLKNINFNVEQKSRVAIVGASGSGKSTLMHLLGGLDVPNSGKVTVCGEDMSALSDASRGRLRNQSLGFIYQFHHLLPEFTALENVAMPLLLRDGSISDAETQAKKILSKVGLANRVLHKPTELSGGERQRVAIARALVTHPKVILADEPTGNLDSKNALQVQNEMLELNKELGTAVVIVTHDSRIAESMDEIYSLEDGMLSKA